MQIILLDKVANLGNVGDQANVKAGYARNFLFPQGKAVPATKANLAFFEEKRAELEAKAQETLKVAKARAEKLNSLGKIEIKTKAGDEGRLFGSIGAKDIVNALSNVNYDVKKNEIRLPEGVLRTIGEHEIIIHLHSDVSAKLIVNVSADH